LPEFLGRRFDGSVFVGRLDLAEPLGLGCRTVDIAVVATVLDCVAVD